MKLTVKPSLFICMALITLTMSLDDVLAQTTDYLQVAGVVASGRDSTLLSNVTVKALPDGVSTVTNLQGSFNLHVSSGIGTLKLSLLGYRDKIIAYNVTSDNNLFIAMDEADKNLDEVMVIAYGNSTKRFSTGNVSKVTSRELDMQPVADPLMALQGRVPGLEITQNSGVPGRNVNVTLRGQNSIAQGSNPFYIVDGVPWLANSLSQVATSIGAQSPFVSINPQDIESIEILKDADATSIYGSRGANGVILITTKKGAGGAAKLEVNVHHGYSELTNTMDLMNTAQYIAMRNEALRNDQITPTNSNAFDLLLYDRTKNVDWKELLIGNNPSLTNASLALNGGNKQTQFRIAGTYRNEGSVYAKDLHNTRMAGSFNVVHRPTNEKFNVSLTVNYSINENNLINRDLTQDIYQAPNRSTYGASGEIAWSENGSPIRANPLGTLLRTFSSNSDNFITNLNVGYSFNPSLDLRLNAGHTKTILNESEVTPLRSLIPTTRQPTGYTSTGKNDFNSWILEPQLNYKKRIDDHKIEVLLGGTLQSEQNFREKIDASNFSSESLLKSLNAAATVTGVSQHIQYRYQAVFGRINYRFSDKYLVNITGRRDGSSRFGPGRQYANFGALGAAWIFSEEAFFKNHFNFIGFGKLRGSYGVTGNDKIGDYQYLDTYTGVPARLLPYLDVNGLIPQRLFNPNYGWENNRKLELALDLGLLDNHLLFSASWYRNVSDNQLVNYLLASQTGFTSVIRNFPASVENTGWEMEMDVQLIKRTSFSWRANANITIPRNSLLAFDNLEHSSYANTYKIGSPLNIQKVYRYLGISEATGIHQFAMEEGRNTIVDLTTRFFGGINNSLTFKGWQLDMFWQFTKRPNVMNYQSTLSGMPGTVGINQPVNVLQRWSEVGDVTSVQRFSATSAEVANANYRYVNESDGAYTDGSFMRLKNLYLSHDLNFLTKRYGWINSLRIYVQGQNLLTVTGYEGHDPETAHSLVLPPLRTFTIGFLLSI